MSHRCKDCTCIKSIMKEDFPDGISDNIASYVIQDTCLKAINMLDNMKNRNLDIDIRDTEGLDENLEIWFLIKMKKS